MKGSLWLAALICSAATALGNAPSGMTAGEVVISTPETIAQGKQNVRNVAEELRKMFRPLVKRDRKAVPAAETPYLKVIQAPDNRAILIYRCRYATAGKLINSVESMISNTGYVESAEEQNLLTINDQKDHIEALRQALPALDMPSPQVLIEAKVIEVLVHDGMDRNLSFSYNSPTSVTTINGDGQKVKSAVMSTAGMATSALGSNNAGDGGKLNWTVGSGEDNFNVAFQWLLTAQDARVLSSPVILVARNEESTISNGQDVPIQSQSITNGSINTSTTFKRVGVTLKVQPKMINGDTVTLLVEPEVSNIQSYQTISQGSSNYSVPVISIRNISTNLKLEDGQIAIMGGLYSSRESISQERIPFLSDMPYVGELFTSKNSSRELIQLLFFLRVRILTPEEVADGVLFDPDELIRTSNEIGEIVRKSPELPDGAPKTIDLVKEEFLGEKPESTRKETGAAL